MHEQCKTYLFLSYQQCTRFPPSFSSAIAASPPAAPEVVPAGAVAPAVLAAVYPVAVAVT